MAITAHQVKELLRSKNKYPINTETGKRIYADSFYCEFTYPLEIANKKWRKAKKKGFTGSFDEYLTPSSPSTD